MTAITCIPCGRPLRAHISWDDVPSDAPFMYKAQFDASDPYWEGYYCPPAEIGGGAIPISNRVTARRGRLRRGNRTGEQNGSEAPT